ncbi:MAG: MFS transporter [Nibricoccus sp.]
MNAAMLPGDAKAPSALYRWTVLLVVSLTMGCGTYYIYDSIHPLQHIFVEQLGFTATSFGMLYSAYAASAIVTLLIGGAIIDRVGTQRAVPLFAVICFFGATLTAVGGDVETMIAGRVLLGLGGESLVVAATTVIAKWFRGRELALAFGIKVMIARLASVAADNSASWAPGVFYPEGVQAAPSWQGPLFLAVGSGLVAVLCAGLYWMLERGAGQPFTPVEKSAQQGKLSFRESLRFNPSYWYLVGVCLCFYSAIFPFRTFAIDLYTNRILDTQGGLEATEAMRILAHQQAGHFAGLLPLSTLIATPLLGFLSDRIGKRATLLMSAALLFMPAFVLIGYTQVSLWIPICMMGVALSVIPAVLWPSVAYLVNPLRLGTAYALMTLIMQIGFFTLNLLIGSANDHQQAGLGNLAGYRLGLLVLSGLAVSGFVCTFLLRRREKGPNGCGLETITTDKPAAG